MVIRMECDYVNIVILWGYLWNMGPWLYLIWYVDVTNRGDHNEILFKVHKLFIQDG